LRSEAQIEITFLCEARSTQDKRGKKKKIGILVNYVIYGGNEYDDELWQLSKTTHETTDR